MKFNKKLNNKKNHKFGLIENSLIFIAGFAIVAGTIVAPHLYAVNNCAGQLTHAELKLNNGTDTFSLGQGYQLSAEDRENDTPLIGIQNDASSAGQANFSIKLPDGVKAGDSYFIDLENARTLKQAGSNFQFVNSKNGVKVGDVVVGKSEIDPSLTKIKIIWNEKIETLLNVEASFTMPIRSFKQPDDLKLGEKFEAHLVGCEENSIKSNSIFMQNPAQLAQTFGLRLSSLSPVDFSIPNMRGVFDREISVPVGTLVTLDFSIDKSDGVNWYDNLSKDVTNEGIYLYEKNDHDQPINAKKLKYTDKTKPGPGEFIIEEISPQNVRISYVADAEKQIVRWQEFLFRDNGQDGYMDRMPKPFVGTLKVLANNQRTIATYSQTPTWLVAGSSALGETKKIPFLTEPTLTPATECGVAPVINIPNQENVQYLRTDEGNIATITAKAINGYVFDSSITTTIWKFDMTIEPCPIEEPEITEIPENSEEPQTKSETKKSTYKILPPNTAV